MYNILVWIMCKKQNRRMNNYQKTLKSSGAPRKYVLQQWRSGGLLAYTSNAKTITSSEIESVLRKKKTN